MIKLKPYKQSKGFCGPASLKMVLEFYGIKKSEQELARKTGSTRNRGTSEARLARTARNFGLKVHVKENANIGDIRKYIAKNIPIIVDWFSPEEAGHYSVVVGIDKKNIYIADPHFGKIRKYEIKWFEERWFDMPFERIIKKGMIIIFKSRYARE